MDQAVQDHLDGVPARTRPLFDRVHRLVLEVSPDADVVLSYEMPTFVVGERRLHVGAWAHGVSLYGWQAGRDAGFSERHPELDSGKGTLRLTHRAADTITDDELRGLLRAVFAP